MQASDWVRSYFVKGCTLTDSEWQDILDNNQQAEEYCGMTIEDAKRLLDSGKYFGHMYKYGQDRVLISYLDKSTTDRMMWRLAFFSYDENNLSADVIVDLIIRSLKEMMVEQYLGKIAPKGVFVRGIYYYTNLENTQNNFMFGRVLDKITDILSRTNFDLFTDFSGEVKGNKIYYYLTYKGA